MATDYDRVRSYYAEFDEWSRLDSAEGVLEFRRACALLSTTLAPASRLLDLGGGPGRYAIELAKEGHSVVLADISPELLDHARQKAAELDVAGAIESYDEVNATDLGRYPDGSFDAVVTFGPFYHLLLEEERHAAALEIRRVLRPEGIALVAFIPRLAGLIGLIARTAMVPEQVMAGSLTGMASTGIFRNGSATGFQEGYYPTPEEMRGLFETAGFEIVDMLSLRSIANRMEHLLHRLTDNGAAEVDRLIDDLARDPAILATSGHAVIVVRKVER